MNWHFPIVVITWVKTKSWLQLFRVKRVLILKGRIPKRTAENIVVKINIVVLRTFIFQVERDIISCELQFIMKISYSCVLVLEKNLSEDTVDLLKVFCQEKYTQRNDYRAVHLMKYRAGRFILSHPLEAREYVVKREVDNEKLIKMIFEAIWIKWLQVDYLETFNWQVRAS